MDATNIVVTEVTNERSQLVSTHQPKRLNLGGGHSLQAALLEGFLGDLDKSNRQQNPGRVFEISWKGDKSPRGAVLLGHEVGWIQNGEISSVEGVRLGSFDRVVVNGGADRLDHKILVYLNPGVAPRPTIS
jgi:hypothetical protein